MKRINTSNPLQAFMNNPAIIQPSFANAGPPSAIPLFIPGALPTSSHTITTPLPDVSRSAPGNNGGKASNIPTPPPLPGSNNKNSNNESPTSPTYRSNRPPPPPPPPPYNPSRGKYADLDDDDEDDDDIDNYIPY